MLVDEFQPVYDVSDSVATVVDADSETPGTRNWSLRPIVPGTAALALAARMASLFAFGLALPQFSMAQLPGLAAGGVAAFVLDPGPLGEELGWRGFALPRLLARWNGLTAALMLGTIWGVWHLPAFFIPGMAQTQVPIWPFMINIISVSVLMTWAVNRAQGSVPLAILFHWSINRFEDLCYPGAMMTALTFAGAALILVAVVGTDLGVMREVAADAQPRRQGETLKMGRLDLLCLQLSRVWTGAVVGTGIGAVERTLDLGHQDAGVRPSHEQVLPGVRVRPEANRQYRDRGRLRDPYRSRTRGGQSRHE